MPRSPEKEKRREKNELISMLGKWRKRGNEKEDKGDRMETGENKER